MMLVFLYGENELGFAGPSEFGSNVNSRIEVKYISCSPDPVGNSFCSWEFIINQ